MRRAGLLLGLELIRPGLKIELSPDNLSKRLNLHGVLILNIDARSSAAEAGLLPTMRDRFGRLALGDVIVAVHDQPVKSANDVWLAFEEHRIGDTVTLTVMRDDEQKQITVQLEAVD